MFTLLLKQNESLESNPEFFISSLKEKSSSWSVSQAVEGDTVWLEAEPFLSFLRGAVVGRKTVKLQPEEPSLG